jgi:UDP-N-acetylglucosamine transferase subunit ALG13
MPPAPPRVLVTVGTDVHPFDRLLSWAADFAREHPQLATWQVQHGWSRLPTPLEGTPFLAFDELHTAMAEAAVIVSHGGPGTIAEARRAGARPIVVPRQAAAGEHVDDHQQRFARRLAEAGLVLLAEDRQTFVACLHAALEDLSRVATDGKPLPTGRAVTAFAAAAAPLLAAEPRPVRACLASRIRGRRRGGKT